MVVQWEMKENIVAAKIKSLRYVAFQAAGSNYTFLQMNLEFKSLQRLQIFKVHVNAACQPLHK